MVQLKGLDQLKFQASMPVRGYLTQEDESHYWLHDGRGIWLIRKADVVGTTDWTGTDPRSGGRPVVLYVKDEAEFYELKPYRMNLQHAPLTEASGSNNEIAARGGVRGLETMNALQAQFLRNLGLSENASSEPSPQRNPISWSPAGGELWGPDDCGG
jgi:hypothetical protein